MTPKVAIEVPAGHHMIAVARRGRELGVRDVELGNDQTLRVDVPLTMTTKRRAVPWAVGTASGFAIVAATSMIGAFVAQHEALAIRDRLPAGNVGPNDVADYASDTHWRDDLRATAFATGAATLLSLGVAAALYWFDEPQIKAARLVPLSAHDASLVMRF